MIERCTRSICAKIQKESLDLLIPSGFFSYFNKAAVFAGCYAISFNGNRWLSVRSFCIFVQLIEIISPFHSGYFHMIPGISQKTFGDVQALVSFGRGTFFFMWTVCTVCTVLTFINRYFWFISTFSFLFLWTMALASFLHGMHKCLLFHH